MESLACPVRGCHSPLGREERRLICAKGHSFDRARSGYFNLLQPQERRSKNPGDTAEAVAARRRLHDRGLTRPLLRGISEMLHLQAGEPVLDAGCGEGFYLGSLAAELCIEGYGLDISIPAIDAAARRYPGCEWIVGNADRFIPYADRSFGCVMSITARMNPPEFRRVLRDDGRLLVALPATDDLIELRGVGRDRVERTEQEFLREFTLIRQERVTHEALLDEAAVADVLLSIYRPAARTQPEAKRVTFSFDLLEFRAS